MSKFRALFYPYARIENAGTLNNAILLFDDITIISPNSFMSNYLGEIPSHTNAAKKYMKTIKVLSDEKLVRLVDPSSAIPDYGDAITEGIFDDFFNDDFIKSCASYAKSSWTLSARKLPPKYDDWLRNLFKFLPEMLLDQLITLEWGGTGKANFLYKEICFATQIQFDPDAAKDYFRTNVKDLGYSGKNLEMSAFNPYFDLDSFINKIGQQRPKTNLQENPDLDTRTVTLPFIVGEAIMIGHSLALAAKEGLIPLCDEKVHFNAFNAKARQISQNPGAKKLLEEHGYTKKAKASFLGVEALKASLPSLDNVPIEAVLKFRDTHGDELEHFRVEMAKLATELDSTPWDDGFNEHVMNIIDTTINPVMKEVERSMKSYKEKFWSNALKTVSTAAPLPIVGSIWAGIPSYAAVAIGGGLATLALVLDDIAEKRRIKRNGLSFLIDAQKLK